MSGFDDRKKAQEIKFVQDEENKFKIAARRRKLLALWASEMTGMNEEESLKYAIEVVQFGLQNENLDKVIEKLINDAAERNAALDEEQLRAKNAEFAEIAKKQVMAQQNDS